MIRYTVQAKRWGHATSVGRPEIQKFVGALVGQGATRGLFITTARFSEDARDYARKQHTVRVVLVDGQCLAELMIDHNLGVTPIACYEIKRVDFDFFDDALGRAGIRVGFCCSRDHARESLPASAGRFPGNGRA